MTLRSVSLIAAAGLVLAGCTPSEASTAGTASAPPAVTQPATSSPSPRDVVAAVPEALALAPSPLVDGATGATVIGDPSADGLYVLLGEIGAGVVFPAHTHPDDRITTVIDGTMHFAVGDGDFTAYPAGSVVLTPAGTPHTMWARDGLIRVQEAGDGPSGLDLVEGSP